MVKNMMKLWKIQKFAGFIPHLRVIIYERTQSEIFKNLGRVIYERSSYMNVNDCTTNNRFVEKVVISLI